MTKPIARDLDKCRRDHHYLEQLLERNGIHGFDPNSEVGQYVQKLIDELLAATSDLRSPVVRLQGVEMAVECILLRRSVVTTLIKMKAPPSGDDKDGRSEYSRAMDAYSKLSARLLTAFQIMGVPGLARDITSAATPPKPINEALRDYELPADAFRDDTPEVQADPVVEPEGEVES